MTTLKIYKLEDLEETEPVAILLEGEHLIGRGFLNCNDKRVSRKHAVIIVANNLVVIKSVHINPCFLKSVESNSMSIIPKDKSALLKDNDQFALLSDNFWFKVRIVKVSEQNMESNSFIENMTNKRQGNGHENSIFKKQKVDGPESLVESVNFNEKSPTNGDANKDNTLINITSTSFLLQDKLTDFSYSNNNNETSNATIPVENQTIELINQSNIATVKLKNTSDDNLNLIKDEYYVMGEPESKVEVEEEVDPVNNQETNTIFNLNNQASTSTLKTNNEINNSEDSCIISHNNLDLSNQTPSEDQASTSTTKNKMEINNPEDTNQNNLNPNSNTDNTNQRVRRDKCWYGDSCYRKNPQHRVDLSHPGDDDYDNDSDDNRPECPFGVSCYRTNVSHRRQFKHNAKPAVKPSAGSSNQRPKPNRTGTNSQPKDNESDENDTDNSNDSSSNRKKRKLTKKKGKFNETPDDDYDYDDPFINNESSDEFLPSNDDENDDSDGDDSDIESQETRRLVKEAKKFTKQK